MSASPSKIMTANSYTTLGKDILLQFLRISESICKLKWTSFPGVSMRRFAAAGGGTS